MSVWQSILIATFCLAIVFIVLACLWGAVSLFLMVIHRIESNAAQTSEKNNG